MNEDASNTTILVIDDEPANIQSIINIFQESGHAYNVFSSSNSKLGLEIAMQTCPDIIITDWEMPQLSGIELIKALKNNPKTCEIPVIMATGVNMTSADLKTALDSGAYDFLRKTVDAAELIARINSALRFVSYFKAKLENEKQISMLKEEHYQQEIEAKKRELLSKTMELLQLNNIYTSFQEKLNKIDTSGCNQKTCNLMATTKAHVNDMIASANKQVWSELELHFEQVNADFYKNLMAAFPHLTPNERKLCAYLRLNLSTKDIGMITFQSQRSIEIARTRLRQKLGLTGSDEDLSSFLLNY
jgi:DNA-binding response OmpR family regulator/DNA-binding CsgD family transcriptional regulator